ncbi:hypothetical protein CDCA_CDCA02G0790 [Cyanidium caldarium]|uniref:Small ribosomal subunit protein uS7 domain-containing protein n=1 Tax=Cyanidium caldarium TaxID=2771 RepID=A0AAV9IRP4_CYACA|nr:hypothetical protein CDCA_CDCA02G0790 [Cyanidium caldarium]|eukprot:ctg_606.g190
MSLYTADKVISKLANVIMRDGKKSLAHRIIDEAFWILKREHNVSDPAAYTLEAIEMVRPVVELAPHRVGGRSLQVPRPLSPQRSMSLAIRFLRDAVRGGRKERGAQRRLAAELVDIHRQEGVTMRRRTELHKLAEGNKAYAHL